MRMHPEVAAVEERLHVGAQEEAVVDPVLTVSGDGADVRSLHHRDDRRSSRDVARRGAAIPVLRLGVASWPSGARGRCCWHDIPGSAALPATGSAD